MLNRYKISDATLFIGRVMLSMKKMKAELNEHRYFIERSVERETAHLSKRIALLESCNTTLSGKLALAYQEIATLKRLPPYDLTRPHDLPRPDDLPRKDMNQNESIAKLCIINKQAKKPARANMQEKWGEHVTAA